MGWLLLLIGLAALAGGGFWWFQRRSPSLTTPRSEQMQWNLQRLFSIPSMLAFAFVGLLLVIALPATLFSGTDQFVVAVTPFRDTQGTVSNAGQETAAQLARLIEESSQGRIMVRQLSQVPQSGDQALELAQQQRADVLIWGEIAPGGLVDQASLLPQIAYLPNGPYAPYAWDGFLGRFAINTSFALARSPINGQATIPPLMLALADYAAGNYDASISIFDDVSRNHPELDLTLIRMLRGNLAWARGDFEAAAAEYRATPLLQQPPETDHTAARLANNLGAILYDGDNPATRDALNLAIRLLGGRDMGELRLNLGLEELRANRPAEALAMLEQARRLLPPSTPVMLTLSRAYRALGPEGFTAANNTLTDALGRLSNEAGLVPHDFHELAESRTRAAVLEERGLLRLSQQLEARSPLSWEVLGAQQLGTDQLADVLSDLNQAYQTRETLVRAWERRAVADDAAGTQVSGMVAAGQARRLETQGATLQYWFELVQWKQLALQGVRPPTGFASIWSALVGDRSTAAQQRTRLEQAIEANSSDADRMLILAQNQLLVGRQAEAERWYQRTITVDPNRPEPYYGLALLRTSSNATESRQLLNQALSLQPGFFPARQALADLAEQQRDWPTALEQRRWLHQQRPNQATTVALAQTLRLSGQTNFSEAEQLLLPLANNSHIPALLELSQLYLDFGDAESAKRVLLKAQSINPKLADVALKLGDLLFQQNDLGAAEEQYQLALYQQPTLIQAHLGLADIYTAQDRQDDAVQEFRRALDIGASDPVVLKRIGAALLARNQPAAAASAYEQVVKTLPTDPDAYYWLGESYLRSNQSDQALPAAQKALELRNGTFAEALVTLAEIALVQNRLDDASRLFQQAQQQNPQLTSAALGLGRVAATNGNWALALDMFQRVATAQPQSAETQYWVGRAMAETENRRGAVTAFQRSLELDPNNSDASYELARLQFALNQPEQALENLNRAVQRRPTFVDALLLQGTIYEQLGDLRRADRAFTQAIQADGRRADAYYQRGLIALQQENFSRARADFTSAVNNRSPFPEAHYWLGRTLLVEGQATAALQSLQTAITQRSRYPEAYYYRGIAYEQNGDAIKAVESYRQVLEQDPVGPLAGEARAALNRLGIP